MMRRKEMASSSDTAHVVLGAGNSATAPLMEPETGPVIPCGYGEVALVNWKLHCSPALEGFGPRASGGIALMLILG